MPCTIYILKLEQDKYYVGKTKRPVPIRFKEHVSGFGSEYTRLYKPLRVHMVHHNCDEFDEDKYTKVYMAKYGIDNVRGGSYITIKLTSTDISSLKKELLGANNLCFKCGLSDHFAKECNNQLANQPINHVTTQPNKQILITKSKLKPKPKQKSKINSSPFLFSKIIFISLFIYLIIYLIYNSKK